MPGVLRGGPKGSSTFKLISVSGESSVCVCVGGGGGSTCKLTFMNDRVGLSGAKGNSICKLTLVIGGAGGGSGVMGKMQQYLQAVVNCVWCVWMTGEEQHYR